MTDYRVLETVSEGVTYLRIECPGSGESALILPEWGGTVHQLSLCAGPHEEKAEGDPPHDLLESDDVDEIRENPWFRGRVLFPFDDRVRAGQYRFRGVPYSLPINDPEKGDALHGFLYKQPLRLTLRKSTAFSASVALEGDIREVPGYPFFLHIRILYTLDNEGFHIEMEIGNRGRNEAPFSVGWHPYFRLEHPGPEAASTQSPHPVNGLRLVIPADRYVECDRDLVPSGRLLPVGGTELDFRRPLPVGDKVLDHGFVNRGGYMECLSGGLRLRIRQSDLFAYSQIFVPPMRTSIALEPISAATDAFNHPDLGLRILKPGEKAYGRIDVSLLREKQG